MQPVDRWRPPPAPPLMACPCSPRLPSAPRSVEAAFLVARHGAATSRQLARTSSACTTDSNDQFALLPPALGATVYLVTPPVVDGWGDLVPSMVTIEQAHATFLTIAASNTTGPFEVFASCVHRSYDFLIVGGIRLAIPPWFAPGRAAPRCASPW